MKFFYYDLTFLILFTLGVIIFLYKRRKNLKREGLMYLYRTKVGIKFINYVGGKYKKTLRVFSYLAVISGYLLMVVMLYLLGQIAYIYLRNPDIVRAIKIPPLIPLIPYLPSIFKIDFLPPFYFTYWIIAIAVIAAFHEFAHGIFAKFNKVRVKTTGFGFLGPFLAAFVEPDEKQMFKKSRFQQITILSAGTFTNLVLAIFFFLLLSGFFVLSYTPAGAVFNVYTPAIISLDSIQKIDGENIVNNSNQAILEMINRGLEEDLVLESNETKVTLVKITAGNRSYYSSLEQRISEGIPSIREQLSADMREVIVYEDLPAIASGLRGVITEVDDREIKTQKDLSEVLKNHEVGDEIKIKTKNNEEILEYSIILGEDPNEKGRAVIGIGVLGQRASTIGSISEFFNFFKKTGTHYEPRFNTDLIIFIYNLIWWLALVNISVALVNMLPVGIFDGGRMFMLTVAGITRSSKFGEIAFKIMTWIILGIFFLLMLGWFIAVF